MQKQSDHLCEISSFLRARQFFDCILDGVLQELELLDFRDKIDMLDSLIIEMLTKRTDVVKDLAKLKLQNNLTIFQFERWLEILNTRRQKAIDDGLDKEMIIELFEVIHKHSILLQTSIIRK